MGRNLSGCITGHRGPGCSTKPSARGGFLIVPLQLSQLAFILRGATKVSLCVEDVYGLQMGSYITELGNKIASL